MSYEQQLKISIDLNRCSPELREYVKDLQRQVGKARLLADLRRDLAEDERNLDAETCAFHKPQIGPVS